MKLKDAKYVYISLSGKIRCGNDGQETMGFEIKSYTSNDFGDYENLIIETLSLIVNYDLIRDSLLIRIIWSKNKRNNVNICIYDKEKLDKFLEEYCKKNKVNNDFWGTEKGYEVVMKWHRLKQNQNDLRELYDYISDKHGYVYNICTEK